MIISNSFNRFYFGTVIADIKQNCKQPIEINHKILGHVKVDLSRLPVQGIHKILKQLTANNLERILNPKSLTEYTNKEVIRHIDLIKLMFNQNGFVFKIDDEEWNRLIEEARG